MGALLSRGVSTALLREGRGPFRIRRSFWAIAIRRALLLSPVDREIRALDAAGRLVMFVKHPVIPFPEQVTAFADEAQTVPLFRVQARSFATVNIIFDVVDIARGELLASVQLRGARSMVHDRLIVMTPQGDEIGAMEEIGASLLRRIVPFMRWRHRLVMHGQETAVMRQMSRVVNTELELELRPGPVDPRFVLACALLALMVRARRED